MGAGMLERVHAGTVLPPLRKGRLTSSHIVRWCAAQENWARIHYDESYARNVAKLPGVLINGALKQHLLAQFLAEAFGGDGWIWRIDYQFAGMDLVGQALEVCGTVREVQNHGAHRYALVDLGIANVDLDRVTTTGRGVVVFRADGGALADVLDVELPVALRVNEGVDAADISLPGRIRAGVGSELDRVESDYPLDLSRLRLFADALVGLRAHHYDPKAGAASVFGSVVAPPLFPLHALDFFPGTHPLSDEPEASGREGVAELPRNLAARFGIKPAGSLNGGSDIEVHSLLRPGERVAATCTLAGAKLRRGRAGGAMLIFDTVNRFSEAGGRPLLTERHASIYRVGEGELSC